MLLARRAELVNLAPREAIMSNEPKKEDDDTPPASSPPQLTETAVNEALRKSADGANKLNETLREVFALSDTSATLRLR
jgi:hypothetical protein